MEAKIFNITDSLNAHAEEAYKVLRTNIQFCELDGEIKTLTITSCIPGEGKSTTCINLAISIAGTGKKVLVVDADLRKPMLMKHPGNSGMKGLSNLISGHAALEDVINSTGINSLFFIASGVKPPNPAELVGSARFSEFLKTVREQFDMVIIDTPPLGSVIDGALIASQTDGALLVIQYHTVDYQTAQRVKQQLEKANARILGVVLNKVDRKFYNGAHNYYDFYGCRRDIDKEWMKRFSKIQGDNQYD